MDLAFIGWLLFDERHDVGSHDVKLSHNRSTAICCNARTRLVGVSPLLALRVWFSEVATLPVNAGRPRPPPSTNPNTLVSCWLRLGDLLVVVFVVVVVVVVRVLVVVMVVVVLFQYLGIYAGITTL